jgi:hypothetical protein
VISAVPAAGPTGRRGLLPLQLVEGHPLCEQDEHHGVHRGASFLVNGSAIGSLPFKSLPIK